LVCITTTRVTNHKQVVNPTRRLLFTTTSPTVPHDPRTQWCWVNPSTVALRAAMHLQPCRGPHRAYRQTSTDNVKASVAINKLLPKNHPPRSTLAAYLLSLSHKPHAVIVNGTVKLLAAMLFRCVLDRSEHSQVYNTWYGFEFETASKKHRDCAFAETGARGRCG
jgi:hypothetical protein